MRILIALLLVSLPGTSAKNQQEAARYQESDGEWFGELLLPDDWQLLQMHVRRTPDQTIKGVLDIPLRGVMDVPLTGIRWSATEVAFSASTPLGDLSFSGRSKDGELQGLVRVLRARDETVRFRFAHLAKIDVDACTGGYEADGGRLITIAPWTEQSRGFTSLSVQYNDTLSRRSGSLFPVSPARFVSGGPLGKIFPVELEVMFESDQRGKVTGLTWQERGGSKVHAKRIRSYREQQVTFKNKTVTLAGTLMLPAGPGPHPAIVLSHGSGPQRRWRGIFEQLFVRRGVAVLSYDKRGVAQSTGDWRTSSFVDLADDAVAGAVFLKTLADIDSRRIGFFGLSQGGWIAPLAASRFKEAAFVVAVAGGGLTPERQELLDTESDLRDAHFSEAEIGEAIEFQKAKNTFMRTGNDWDEYEKLRLAGITKKWYGFGNTDAWGPRLKDHPYWASQRLIYFYDPAPALQSLRCPLLFVCGALDSPKAVTENVANVRVWLQQAGNKDATIKVFSNAGHNLFIEEPDSKAKLTTGCLVYSPGYLELLERWTAEHAGTLKSH
jgi:pimeloyl-ACP methyl ester carboxylesterase